MLPYIVSTIGVSLFPVGRPPITVAADDKRYAKIVKALIALDYDGALAIADTEQALTEALSGTGIEVRDGEVLRNGVPLSGVVVDRILQFQREGLPMQHYVTFLDNLLSNPSATAIKELFLFLEAAKLPVTEDGHFLAYKAVRSDFRDKHSGKFDNSPGTHHRMPRNEVDDVRDRTCSYGFHAAAYDYAKNFMGSSGRMVAVKINPADVVSIPSDYGNQKLRTCAYTVMFEIEGAADIFTNKPLWGGDQPTNTFDYDDADYSDEDTNDAMSSEDWEDFWRNEYPYDDDADDSDDDVNEPVEATFYGPEGQKVNVKVTFD